MIIVIDGPAGSGKSTTAKAVADKLDIQYLDSGALYRTLTVLFLESGKDETKFFELVDQNEISFAYEKGEFKVAIDSQDLTNRIREIEVTEEVSTVAAMPEVRHHVNNIMHQAIKEDVWIAEGRDLGTAVFPNADIKFYMMADVDTRAKRRHKELANKGLDVSREEVRKKILKRDEVDSKRKSDPLRKADDAIILDTTNMDFEQQVDFICSSITNKLDI